MDLTEILTNIENVKKEVNDEGIAFAAKLAKNEFVDEDKFKEFKKKRAMLKTLESIFKDAVKSEKKHNSGSVEISADLMKKITSLEPLISDIVRSMPKNSKVIETE